MQLLWGRHVVLRYLGGRHGDDGDGPSRMRWIVMASLAVLDFCAAPAFQRAKTCPLTLLYHWLKYSKSLSRQPKLATLRHATLLDVASPTETRSTNRRFDSQERSKPQQHEGIQAITLIARDVPANVQSLSIDLFHISRKKMKSVCLVAAVLASAEAFAPASWTSRSSTTSLAMSDAGEGPVMNKYSR